MGLGRGTCPGAHLCPLLSSAPSPQLPRRSLPAVTAQEEASGGCPGRLFSLSKAGLRPSVPSYCAWPSEAQPGPDRRSGRAGGSSRSPGLPGLWLPAWSKALWGPSFGKGGFVWHRPEGLARSLCWCLSWHSGSWFPPRETLGAGGALRQTPSAHCSGRTSTIGTRQSLCPASHPGQPGLGGLRGPQCGQQGQGRASLRRRWGMGRGKPGLQTSVQRGVAASGPPRAPQGRGAGPGPGRARASGGWCCPGTRPSVGRSCPRSPGGLASRGRED